MKITNVKKLQDMFMGKVCTVLTTTVNKTNFQDTQFADFFTGIIQSIDEDGIFAKHHITGCNNFYHFDYVVGILEEQVIEEDDPKYQEIVNEMKKIPPAQNQGVLPLSDTSFINPDILAELKKQSQNSMIKKNH